MIKYNGHGYINQTGYGVMKLGNEPTIKGQFTGLTPKYYEKLDKERKYGKGRFNTCHANRCSMDSLVYTVARNGRSIGTSIC